MTTRQTHLGRELALLALLALCWGASYTMTKIAVHDLPPFTLIAARVTIAAVFLSVVMAFSGVSLPRDGATWRRLFIQAFFNSIGAWTILAWGQRHIDSGLASVLNSTSPIFVFFITWFITRHENVSLLKLGGALLGLGGVVLIVGTGALKGLGDQVAGELAALFAAVLYACAAIHGKRFSHLPSVVTAAGTMLCASVTLVPLALVIESPWRLQPSTSALLATVGLGVFSTGLAFLIYFRLIHTLGSMGVASQSYLRAGVGVGLGIVLLGERITPLVGLGLVAALLGVAAINMPQRVRQNL